MSKLNFSGLKPRIFEKKSSHFCPFRPLWLLEQRLESSDFSLILWQLHVKFVGSENRCIFECIRPPYTPNSDYTEGAETRMLVQKSACGSGNICARGFFIA